FPARIEAYSALLALRQQLDPLPLRQYVANFSQHYTIASLQKALAKEYYDYARALPGQDVQAYLERSRLYWQSTQYDDYQNNHQQYQLNDKQYRQQQAALLYQQAKV